MRDVSAVERPLEEVAAARELCAAGARGELSEVAQPEGERVRVLEEGDALLVRLARRGEVCEERSCCSRTALRRSRAALWSSLLLLLLLLLRCAALRCAALLLAALLLAAASCC